MNDRIYKGRTLVTVDDWLTNAAEELTKANIPSARLDAEILLCYMLGVDRAWLVAHADDSLHATALHHKGSPRRGSLIEHGDELLLKRLQREPIAYITGHKEFYGREFLVTPDVLIPRPESESLIELAKKLVVSGRVIDVGTGSGCLGITLKLENPQLDVTLSDISPAALAVAKKNATILKVKVKIVESDLLSTFLPSTSSLLPSTTYHLPPTILANLPYVDKTWQTSPETSFEPAEALYAKDQGLELIKKCIQQSSKIIVGDGYLVLEADPDQHQTILAYAKDNGFKKIQVLDYALALQKIV